jgi:formamidopyrimidine-DNA glycosylase
LDRKLPQYPEDIGQAGIEHIERLGKWLILRTDRSFAILIHLRMTGRLVWSPGGQEKSAAVPHERWRLEFIDGATLSLVDPRRFATIQYLGADQWPGILEARLGPDPLAQPQRFTSCFLRSRIKDRKAPIKSVLMDQQVVAGMGNIYASEALHRTGIHPNRAAFRISENRADRLHKAILETFNRAIAGLIAGPDNDLRWHAKPVSEREESDTFQVYGKAGKSCPRCVQGILRKITQSGRSTYYCPRCQF